MTNGQPDLLIGLPPDEVDQVLSLGSRITLTSGAELFHMGTPADSLYLVSQGRIKLTLPMQIRGQEQDVFVEERRPVPLRVWFRRDSAAPVYAYRHRSPADGSDRPFPVGAPRALRRLSRHRLCDHAEPGCRDRPAPATVPGDVAARYGAHGRIAVRLTGGFLHETGNPN